MQIFNLSVGNLQFAFCNLQFAMFGADLQCLHYDRVCENEWRRAGAIGAQAA
jgi:hypothetical protein